MEVVLQRIGNFKFELGNSKGNKAILDGPASMGDGDEGIGPMEMVLGSLAGCSSIDILSILKKTKEEVRDFRVRVTARRREEVPMVFTEIDLHFHIKGTVKEVQVQRAIDLSLKKYCSVAKMLEKTAVIRSTYTLEK